METTDKTFIGLRKLNDQQEEITEIIGVDGAIAANDFCMEIFGTSLATITSQYDQNEFNNLCNALNEFDEDSILSPSCWIGSFYDSTSSDYIYFKTLTTIQYTNWLDKNNNNDQQQNDNECIVSKNGLWQSTSCDEKSNYYICDHPERKFSGKFVQN